MDNLMSWLHVLHEEDEIVEIRSIDPKPTISGYFRANSPHLTREIAKYPGRTFYQTLNVVKDACYDRLQHEKFLPAPKETTSDRDIAYYRWLLIDADPVRPSGVSATEQEKLQAKHVVNRVRLYLQKIGFSAPVIADSGNGYHLLYRIQADTRHQPTLASFLRVMDRWFSTEEAQIDTAVGNPARITKLYGTVAHKGASTTDRPHRESKIVLMPERIDITPFALVEQLAQSNQEHSQAMTRSCSPNRSTSSFDAEQFLMQHGVRIHRKICGSSYTKLVLEECPFNPAHRAPDAAVFLMPNGAIGFKCLHNSCSDYSWHDVRMKLDPDAYRNSTYAPHQAARIASADRDKPAASEPNMPPRLQMNKPAQPAMLNIAEVEDYDRSKIVVIRSRLERLDTLIGGFNKGELSIWSGSNASGKSTLVGQLGLAAVHQGYTVALFSGEMNPSKVKYWLYLQAAGKEQVEPDPLCPMHHRLKQGIRERLDKALSGKIAIYNNDYGSDWEQVILTIHNWVEKQQADVVVIDNLMALNLPADTQGKYDMQTRIVTVLSQMAKKLNIHIHFICHPRKTVTFLRKTDISGTADITNAADNVFMMHRINQDFLTNVKQIYPKLSIPNGASNAIEIMKNRDLGVCDEMIFLFFDATCKTMSNIRGKNPGYAWEEDIRQGFTQIGLDDADLPDEWKVTS